MYKFCHPFSRKLEEEYVSYAADVEKRALEVGASTPEIKKEAPLCPICLKVRCLLC